MDFPNNRCLSKAGINQYTGEQYRQPPIFGTAIGMFSKDPLWVCKAIEGNLDAHGVSLRYKDPQCWKSSINFAIGSIKPGVCTEGIKHVVQHSLEQMEESMIKAGVNTEWEGKPQPECRITVKNARNPRTQDNTNKIELKRECSIMMAMRQIEYKSADDGDGAQRMTKVWYELDSTGQLKKLFGKSAGLIFLNDFLPKGKKESQDHLIELRANLTFNCMHQLVIFSNLVEPGFRFKPRYQDGTKHNPTTVAI